MQVGALEEWGPGSGALRLGVVSEHYNPGLDTWHNRLADKVDFPQLI